MNQKDYNGRKCYGDDNHDLIDWYKSTGMKPYLDVLPNEDSRNDFLNDWI